MHFFHKLNFVQLIITNYLNKSLYPLEAKVSLQLFAVENKSMLPSYFS